ncbi:ABC transporter permease [Nakamurella lactea]|uniref:ABC transporter permease n=1 Tax=Nakamurella lactea TaxID=459515 RepID=UPI000A040955|nr:ABC transporter permease [Nakamurella lactea]
MTDSVPDAVDARVAASAPPLGRPPARFAGLRRRAVQFFTMPTGFFGAAILVIVIGTALFAPLIVSPADLDVTKVSGPSLNPPLAGYPLGTDQAGRSVLDLVIWGTRSSLVVGLIATALTVVVGTTIGLVAGHYGGWISRLLMQVTDWFIALPGLPLAISLAAVLGQGNASIIIAIAVTSWTGTARLVRAQTLAVSARPFVERAKALGAGDGQVMRRQILPSVVPIVLVTSTLKIADSILSAATLTFLGLGNPMDVSWGSILNSALGQGALTAGAWWYLIPPGVAILIVVLGFTLCGRALETIINPRTETAR